MTSTIQIWGFGHLTGDLVQVTVGGLYAGEYTVAADGSVTVNMGSDPDGLLTDSYLAGLDSSTAWGELATNVTLNDLDNPITVTIPVAVGLSYTSQGQVVRPTTQDELKSNQGPGVGKTRRVHRAGFLFHNTLYPSVGTDFADTLETASLTGDDGYTPYVRDTAFSGVHWQSIIDEHSYDGMVSWQITDPYPCTICSVTGFIETAEN